MHKASAGVGEVEKGARSERDDKPEAGPGELVLGMKSTLPRRELHAPIAQR